MNSQCLNAIMEIIEVWKLENPGKTPKVLSVGYPDIIVNMMDIPLEGLKEHPESARISSYHGRFDIKVPTCESFFKAQGAEFTVTDVKKWRGNELMLDLNYPIPKSLHDKYDIVLDLGTSEHVFNIGTVMNNYKNLVPKGGHIVHFNPAWMPNHGFFNFSPTFFYDWYMANGCSILHQTLWLIEGAVGEPEKCVSIPKTERFELMAKNASLLTLVKKVETTNPEPIWPMQTKYAKMETMG